MGRILRDNAYGTIEEDAWRRDFTVNALYYDIRDFSVIDYVGGVEDLKRGVLRLIGEPMLRYREDPVRMLRAVRFAVKLGLRIDTASEQPLTELGGLLEQISPARLFDETLKLFHGGMALQTFEALRHYELFARLFPQADAALSHQHGGFPNTLVGQALANTDLRVAEDKPVTPAFLVAALLWDPTSSTTRNSCRAGWRSTMREPRADTVISQQVARLAIPRRFTQMTRESAPAATPRHPTPRRARKLFEHPRFRAAYDFLALRALAGEPLGERQWWTRFQAVEDAGREGVLETCAWNSPPAANPPSPASPVSALNDDERAAYIGLGSNLDDPAARPCPGQSRYLARYPPRAAFTPVSTHPWPAGAAGLRQCRGRRRTTSTHPVAGGLHALERAQGRVRDGALGATYHRPGSPRLRRCRIDHPDLNVRIRASPTVLSCCCPCWNRTGVACARPRHRARTLPAPRHLYPGGAHARRWLNRASPWHDRAPGIRHTRSDTARPAPNDHEFRPEIPPCRRT